MNQCDFGISQKDWAILKSLLITPLMRAGYRLYVFGSRAKGNQRKYSDLDILVDDSVVKTRAWNSAISSIIEDLENSNLPFRVDLVLKNDLAGSYLGNVTREMVEVT